jgi:hypothetical protein
MGNNAKNPSNCKIIVTHKPSQQESECYQGIEEWWFDLQQSKRCYLIVTSDFFG